MRRIVVHLKACPTRLLGPYGCEWAETPTLDRLAAEGVVFDGHYAVRPGAELPSPSYATVIDGFDADHVNLHIGGLKDEDNGLLIVELDYFAVPWVEFPDSMADLNDEDERKAFFGTLETCVNKLDQYLSGIVALVSANELTDSTLILVTSSSGLPLGEHGVLGITSSRLHEELVHLPLIVRFPNARLAGYRVAGFTTYDDLAELLATSSTERLESLILGTAPTRESVLSTRGEPPVEASLRTADSCLILSLGDNPHPPLLYDRPDDRFEVNDLSTRQPDRIEELKVKIHFTAEGAENAE